MSVFIGLKLIDLYQDPESSRSISALANPREINTMPQTDKPYKLHKRIESVHKGQGDASSPLISRSSKLPTSNRKTAKKGDDDEDDEIPSWNHLLPEILDEKLRPLKRKSMSLRRSYTDAEIRGIQSGRKNVHDKKRHSSTSPAEKPPEKRLKRDYRRMPRSQAPQGCQPSTPDKNSRGKGDYAKSLEIGEESSDTDSDVPLRPKRRGAPKKALLTPAPTEDKEVTSSRTTITLDSSSEDGGPSQKSQKGGNPCEIKVERVLTTGHGILSQAICQKTTLLVMADHEKDKAPITIALPQCRSSDDLFDSLVRESELPNDLARKVKSVSVTFKWNEKRLRLRKHHAEDWQRFQKEVSLGWESGELGEECEVEVMLHMGG